MTLANPEAYPGADKTPVPKAITLQDLIEGKRASDLFRKRRSTFQRIPRWRSPILMRPGSRPPTSYP